MKNKGKLLGLAIVIAAIVFNFAACSDGGGSSSEQQYEDPWVNPWLDPWVELPPGNGEQTPEGASVPGNTLAEQLAWLQSNAQSDTAYTLTASADEDLAYQPLQYLGKSNITITLIGNSSEKIIHPTSGYLFYVANDITLILDENITLQGAVLVYGGTLVMNAGAKIIGNPHGRGVYMRSGTFTMEGGEISGNTGSGVYVVDGIFTMNGGAISGNSVSHDSGGGVYSVGGTFIMNGGKISGNSVSDGYGGGVAASGTFTMNGGEITNNTASTGGGVAASGTFTMNGGKISGNSANRDTGNSGAGTGGGVYMGSGTFTMNNGKISGNTAEIGGGVIGGTFTMNDGEISGNTAVMLGGGVHVVGTFTMNNGKISGNTATMLGGGGVCVQGLFTMNGGEISGNTASSGGGVYVLNDYFRISNGIVYGSDADAGKANTTTKANSGAALFGLTLQYGTGSTWTNISGARETTIRVINGVLQ